MTRQGTRSPRRLVGVVCTISAALALSACGSDQPEPSGTGGAGGPGPVATRDLPGVGTVLVDAGGRTLYYTDSDRAGEIRCTADCLELWHPAMAPDGDIDAPVADIGVVARPDGQRQIAFKDKPLYTFALDGPDRPASGNNETDTFGGVEFTWHAVVLTADAGEAPPSESGGHGY